MATERKVPVLDNGNKIPTEKLGGGGASASTFLRGDQTWAVPLAAPPQPSVHVYRQLSTQSIPSLTYTRVDWNGEDWDVNNEFDLATDRYTAATAGKRLVVCSVFWTSAADQKLFEIYIYKNGNLFKVNTVRTSGMAGLSTSISAIIDLQVNEYLEIYVYQNTTSSRSLDMNKATTFLNIQGLL